MSRAVALRRLPIVILNVITVTLIALAVSAARPERATAEALVIVRSGAGPEGPGNANEAARLASTYAQVIAADTRILDRVAEVMATSRDVVEENLDVRAVPETSLVEIVYTDADADTAIAGASAVAQAVTEAPVSPAIARGSIAVVRLPVSANVSRGDTRTAILVGLVFGLGLGLFAAVAWNRADRRIDAAGDVAAVADVPASDLTPGESVAAGGLLLRWSELVPAGSDIALVPVAARAEPDMAALAALLARLAKRDGLPDYVVASTEPHGQDGALRLRAAPSVGRGGEAIALQADLTVLVVRAGARAAHLSGALAALERFGRRADWIVVLQRDATMRADGRTAPSR